VNRGKHMAEFPALPLWTDAYLADTRHLTAAQHGAYLLLLMTAWRTPDCKLPNDDDFLCRWSGMGKRQWEANRDVVLAFWKRDENNKLYQPRLVDEQNYVRLRSNKNLQSARARWLKNKDTGDANAYAKPMPNSCETDAPTPTPTPTPLSKKEKVKKEDWISEEVWKAFVEMRQKIRKPLTAYSAKLVIGKLQKMRERGFDPNEALATTIENCWASVYEPRQSKYATASQAVPKRSPADEREQRIVEKAMRVQAMLDADKRNGNGIENALTIGKEERNYE